MTPAFSNWQEFFAMGGYAPYVWLAVASALIALGLLVLDTVLQRQRLLKGIRQRNAREQRIRAAKRNEHPPAATGEHP